MAHLQYMPGDPRLVDKIVYELKSKGIFDQFRKDCIADVDTRPAYQNLRQRVESSVSTFLSRQCWQPDLNKNQLREKLRKHILDGNYLEQGVERIVDQVVNPKVASVFIPQVEDLVYNYLGITRKKNVTETSNEKVEDLLPTDLEAVSPGSVKSNDGADDKMDIDSSDANETKMEIDEQKVEIKNESNAPITVDEENGKQVTELSSKKEIDLDSDKTDIPLPSEDIKVENIPSPNDSPPRVDVTKIELPKESPDIPLPDSIIASSDIPLPDEIRKDAKDDYFKPINSDEDESSSDSSLRRNMSPLTPIRNFNNENSCDAQQAFENDLGNSKDKEQKEPSTFRFAIENKLTEEEESRIECLKIQKKEIEQMSLSYQFNHQVNINNFNTPLYEDSSNSNNLQIDYESDANSKANLEIKANEEQSMEDSKKDRKVEDKKSSHKSSRCSRDSSKYSSSKDKRSDSKPSSSRDSSRHDKKSSRDDSKSKSSHKERSSDKNDKKDSDKKERDSSRHRSSHKSSSHRDSKSHKSSSSSSSQRRSSSNKHSDDKKSSSSSNHKEKSDKTSERSSDKSSRERSSKDSKSSSHRSDKDRKSSSSKTSSSKHEEKDKDKKSKKDTDDHYGLSGRGNSTRRSTDRDSNDGSSSSKGSHNPSSTKSSSSQKDSKGHSSKSDNTSPSGESTSPSDKENVLKETKKSDTVAVQSKPIVRIDTRLELPMTSPPRLPFVPDVTLRKPKIAANLEEAKKLMKMRRFLDEEQKRMNQEAALLLEFQANVRPSLSQVYSSIPGPELEFACVVNNEQTPVIQNNPSLGDSVPQNEAILISNPTNALLAVVNAQNIEDIAGIDSESSNLNESNDSNELNNESIHKTESPPESEVIKDETTSESEQTSVQTHEDVVEIHDVVEARIPDVGNDIEEIKEVAIIAEDTITVPDVERSADNNISSQELDAEINQETDKDDQDKLTEYFEVTVIAEELSESEETENVEMENFENDNRVIIEVKEDHPLDNNNTVIKKTDDTENSQCIPDEQNLKYFTDSEKYEAELQKERFDKFLKEYTERQCNNRIYLINCDSYEESVVKGVLEPLGSFDVVSYQRNGHLKLPKTKSIVKNVNVASEVSLPFDNNEFEAAANELEMDLKVTRQTVLSPVKSECSFELSSDYDAKLDEMVNNASRQEIMEIILGNAMSNESPSKMPKIDYVSESNIESEEVTSVKTEANCLKRKLTEVETTVNNNRPVLTPRKLRKMSASDQITSTTEESEPPPTVNVSVPNNTRSKYLGRARRVGLPRPRKPDQPTSPSSDKSVENYEQNTKSTPAIPATPNGKVRPPQRNKIQRYDTSDLYKPKLQYLSRRNNIN